MAQWKIKVVPSGPCRIVGLVENVGAIPSTCGNDGASIAKRINYSYDFKIITFLTYFSSQNI